MSHYWILGCKYHWLCTKWICDVAIQTICWTGVLRKPSVTLVEYSTVAFQGRDSLWRVKLGPSQSLVVIYWVLASYALEKYVLGGTTRARKHSQCPHRKIPEDQRRAALGIYMSPGGTIWMESRLESSLGYVAHSEPSLFCIQPGWGVCLWVSSLPMAATSYSSITLMMRPWVLMIIQSLNTQCSLCLCREHITWEQWERAGGLEKRRDGCLLIDGSTKAHVGW